MKRKNLIIISVVGIIIVLLSLLGITYGFFATRVIGNTNDKTVYLETSTLRLDYDDNDSYIISSNIYPTFKSTKTFEVTNTGDVVLDYDVYIENVINTFINTDELTIKITCTSNIDGNTCNGYDNSFPTKNKKLLTNNIKINEKHTYELEFEYIDTGENQSIDMGKVIQGRIQISNPSDVVTLKGNVSGYDDSYYIEIVNTSIGKSVTSEIVNGQYILTSIFPGENIVYIKDSTGSTVVSNTLNIRKNSIANINSSATVINTMEESEWVFINMTISNDESALSFAGVKVSSDDVIRFSDEILVDNNGGFSDSVQSLYVSNTTGIDFSQVSSDTNGKGLYYTSTNTQDSKITHYFRGDVSNNYVKFGKSVGYSCEFNGKSIEILGGQTLTEETCAYNALCVDANGTYIAPGNGNVCESWNLTTTEYYAEYKENAIDLLWRIVRINEDGTIRLVLQDDIGISDYNSDATNGILSSTTGVGLLLNNWYSSNLANNPSLLSNTGYCLYTSITDNLNGLDYDNRSRLESSPPTLKFGCDNRYNELIGLITADEVAYAGGVYNTSNTSFYLYSDNSYWTITPVSSEYVYSHLYEVNDGKILSKCGNSSNDTSNVRPVINLISTLQISDEIPSNCIKQDGTISCPYIIETN